MIKTLLSFVLCTAVVLGVVLGLCHLGLTVGFLGLDATVVTALGLALTFIVKRYSR